MESLRVASSVFWVLMLISTLAAQSAEHSAVKETLQRGDEAAASREYGDALAAYKKAVKLDKSCANCYLGMAAAYLHMGDFDNVMSSCDKALSSATDDAQRATAHNLKGNALTSLAGLDRKQLAKAESEFRSAIRLDPGAAPFYLNLGSALLRESRDEEAIQILKKCLTLNPSGPVAELAQSFIANPRRGREAFAPDFQLTTMQGQDLSLKQLAGKVIVLDFWATWCPPCRASVPELKQLTKKYSSEQLTLISISADDDEHAWREFTAAKTMDWAQYRDADNRIKDAFSVHSFPTYLVIDGEGIIRQRIVGLDPRESVVHRLKATLEAMPQLKPR